MIDADDRRAIGSIAVLGITGTVLVFWLVVIAAMAYRLFEFLIGV